LLKQQVNKELPKKTNHLKRNSANFKFMNSKENIEYFETPKFYGSLLRGKQSLLENKTNEKK